MSLKKTIQYIVAGNLIRKTEQEAQSAAYLLVRRDLELTQANEKLKILNNAKGDFVAMAAHQLRTPITTVSWYAEQLQQGSLGEVNEKQEEYLQTIQTSTRHMSQLIETLLYISRLELGTNEVHNKEFVLGKTIEHIHKRFNVEEEAKNINIQIETEDLKIYSDKTLFDIIIQNLLSNAMKYTPKEGQVRMVSKLISSNVAIGGRTFSQQQLALVVSDTGYGIPSDQKDKIFTRLFRAGNIQKLGIGGTGLGLYLVKLITQKMGGEVWFETKESVGTTFYVAIPHALVRKA